MKRTEKEVPEKIYEMPSAGDMTGAVLLLIITVLVVGKVLGWF